MKELQKKDHPRKPIIAVLLVIILLVFGVVTWSFTSVKKNLLQSSETNKQEKRAQNESPQKDSNKTPTIVYDPTKLTKTTPGPETEAEGNTTKHSSGGQADEEVIPPCFSETPTLCVIREDDPLIELLGGVGTEGLLVNGSYVKPTKMVFRTSYSIFSDEQLKDAAGKVLLSTNKSFNEKTKTLTIMVGINQRYYQGLNDVAQNSFTTSQLVRSLLAMIEESPDNYIKVEQIVRALGNWQPARE